MRDRGNPRLYCCHSLRTRDAADVSHVLSVGIDLAPALNAQGFDSHLLIDLIDQQCGHGDGVARLPKETAEAIRTASHVLNIAWVARSLEAPASIICPRSRSCPRTTPCGVS